MNVETDSSSGVITRLVEGSLVLSSSEEFEDLMSIFPDKPEIYRAYADWLSKRGQDEAAYFNYNKSADFFLRDSKTFQAIVAKILSWSIIKPSHSEGRAFHTALQASVTDESPLHHFFVDINYMEFIAIMLRLVRIRFDADRVIIRHGEENDDIYFIVSGILEEKTYQTSENVTGKEETSSQHLSDNDIFGEVFPLERRNYSRADIRAQTQVELVKIPKATLKKICRRYPKIERLLIKIYKGPSASSYNRSWSSVRRSPRHDKPIRTTVTLFLRKQEPQSVTFEGMSKDISLGGTCIDLGLKYGSLRIEAITGSKANINIKLPDSEVGITIPGSVVWSNRIKEPGGTSTIAGIRFDNLNKDMRDFLNVYCFGYENAQNLMWGLWEDYLG